jgi:hypothetical protein
VAGGSGAPLYASPDRGGFSHYIVVRVGADKVSYDVIEPGRLYLEEGAATDTEAKFWVVNTNDLDQPLPLRGLDVEVAEKLGSCPDLTASAVIRKRDAWVTLGDLAVGPCAPAGGGKQRIHLSAPAPLPEGSVQVTVRRK